MTDLITFLRDNPELVAAVVGVLSGLAGLLGYLRRRLEAVGLRRLVDELTYAIEGGRPKGTMQLVEGFLPPKTRAELRRSVKAAERLHRERHGQRTIRI